MERLIKDIRNCTNCASQIDHTPRPIIQISSQSQLLIIGQAPGRKVHESGIPWDDASGKRLRSWLGVADDEFYNPKNIGLIPMSFCYPGMGKSGDLPPLKDCAPLWFDQLFKHLTEVKLTLLIGMYSQEHFLGKDKLTLTERVMNFENYLPKYLPLPHPSPRNIRWFKNNPWFEEKVIPKIQKVVKGLK
jgi:uracil-DNA glycosylase